MADSSDEMVRFNWELGKIWDFNSLYRLYETYLWETRNDHKHESDKELNNRKTGYVVIPYHKILTHTNFLMTCASHSTLWPTLRNTRHRVLSVTSLC